MFTEVDVGLILHILFLSDNFFPEVNAPASRTHDHAKEWVNAGHQVTIITCVPNFPKGQVFDGYRNKVWQEEVIDGIRVVRVWSYIAANEGFSKRILDYLSYMITSFLASFLIRKVDLVVGTSPQFFTAVSAWLVAFYKRKPFVFELRDLWPESIRAVGAMHESKLLVLLEKLELFLYRRADRIIVVTNSFRDNLVKRGIDGKKISVVTNGVDVTKFKPQEKDVELIGRYGFENKFIVGYVGTLGLAHALETVLFAAKITSQRGFDHNIHFLFLGDGASKMKLQELAAELELKNVTFLASVPKAVVVNYWSIIDISIISLKKTDLFKTVIPSKMFESMCMGIPILHAVSGESAEIIEKTGVGITVEPESSSAIAEEIIRLSQDRKTLAALGRNGRIASKSFDRTRLAHDMLDVFAACYSTSEYKK